MFKLNITEISFIGLVIEGFLYGLYSGIFALYLQIQVSNKDTNKMRNIIFCSICVLYILSVVVFVCDIAVPIYQLLDKPVDSLLQIVVIQATSFACSDFFAQLILIYRCWVVWGCNFRVVIIPTLLSLAFLGTWLASTDSEYISLDKIITPRWAVLINVPSYALSLTVNALVTGLIVFRIFKVFREIRATSDDHISGATAGNKLRHVISVLIESGMTLFSIQLAAFVVNIVQTDSDTSEKAYAIVIGSIHDRGYVVKRLVIGSIYDMLTGITPTIILVRTSLGLSFYHEKSMEEVGIGSLRFAPGSPDLVPEMGSSIGMDRMVDQDSRLADDDIVEVQT